MVKMRWIILLLAIPAMLMAANPGDVVINEICWMGTHASSGDEWIELLNTTGSAITLTDWYITDDGTADTLFLTGSIPANGYYLIEDREEATDVVADMIDGGMSLANTGDALELFDDLNNSIDALSTASTSGGWYAGVNGSAPSPDLTMERKDPAGPDSVCNWGDNDAVTVNGNDANGNPLTATPKAQNSVYEVGACFAGDTDPPELVFAYAMGATSVDVLCNEPLDPTTAQSTGNYTMDPDVGVTAATLDGSNPAMVHLTTGIMSVGTLYTLTVSDVEDTSGNAMVDAEASFWGNITPIATAKEDLTDGDFFPDKMGQQVTIQGIVTAGDYTFQSSNSEFFVQDATAGIDNFHAGVVHGVAVGDEVIVTGVVGQYNGLRQLQGPNMAVQILSSGTPVFSHPHIYTVSHVINNGEATEGWFGGIQNVSKVWGTWPAAGSNANIGITDDGGVSVMVMRIDRDTDIDGSVEPTWPIDIAGVFGQYDYTSPPDSGYQLLPRSLADFWPAGTLPVELVSFEGLAGNREVKLVWKTASETDNDHFYLLRSTDCQNYFRASDDIPATNSPTGSNYSYIDRNLVNGTTYNYKLVDVDINGIETINTIIVTVTPSLDASFAPDAYALHQNYPNPFNPTTTITYDVQEAGHVSLKVFDVLGREVATLAYGRQNAASYTVEFDANDIASGIYFYQLKINNFTDMKKMVVVK